MATQSDLTRLRLPYASTMPDKPRRSLLWSEQADEILGKPLDREELLEVAVIATRVAQQAIIQATLLLADLRASPDDDVLLRPDAIALDYGVSLHSVKRAIRTGELPSRPPYPGAKRNLRVRRGDAREWAGRAQAN